jgi:two-component system alkaline phosphatase synthesis response regulator PhoP
MATQERIFRRTEAGTEAMRGDDAAVPSDYRRLLKLIDHDTHLDVVRGCLRQYPDRLIGEWLEELVELGYLDHVAPADPLDLDFTAYFAKAPAAAAEMLAEDAKKLEKHAKDAGSALSRSGAFFHEERLKNRAASSKKPEETVVLIVEDDPDQMALADLRVSMAGYRVRVARSAAALLEELKKDPHIDILLLDVMLPDGNGFDMLAKFRRHPNFALLPIVMLTSQDRVADIKKGLTLGADGYVTKPYSKSILIEAVSKVLKQPRPK